MNWLLLLYHRIQNEKSSISQQGELLLVHAKDKELGVSSERREINLSSAWRILFIWSKIRAEGTAIVAYLRFNKIKAEKALNRGPERRAAPGDSIRAARGGPRIQTPAAAVAAIELDLLQVSLSL